MSFFFIPFLKYRVTLVFLWCIIGSLHTTSEYRTPRVACGSAYLIRTSHLFQSTVSLTFLSFIIYHFYHLFLGTFTICLLLQNFFTWYLILILFNPWKLQVYFAYKLNFAFLLILLLLNFAEKRFSSQQIKVKIVPIINRMILALTFRISSSLSFTPRIFAYI